MTSFDTLKAAKSLQDAGFETQQAEAVVGMVTYALTEGLATKDDVRELHSGLGALENKVAALDSKIDSGLAALDSKVGVLDSKIEVLDSKVGVLDSKLETLDAKIDAGLNNVTQKLVMYLGGIVVGAITLLEVLNRIFPVVPVP